MSEINLDVYKSKIVTNFYRITAESDVKLHKHPKHDEIFYCVKGEGSGVLENEEIELKVGKEFIVPAGKMHLLRSENEMFVTSFLIPLLED